MATERFVLAEKAVKVMEIQTKVPNVCPASHFPKPPSGTEWSLAPWPHV